MKKYLAFLSLMIFVQGCTQPAPKPDEVPESGDVPDEVEEDAVEPEPTTSEQAGDEEAEDQGRWYFGDGSLAAEVEEGGENEWTLWWPNGQIRARGTGYTQPTSLERGDESWEFFNPDGSVADPLATSGEHDGKSWELIDDGEEGFQLLIDDEIAWETERGAMICNQNAGSLACVWQHTSLVMGELRRFDLGEPGGGELLASFSAGEEFRPFASFPGWHGDQVWIVSSGDEGFDILKLESPLVLESVHLEGGYADQRFALSNGDIVQMHTGCGEGRAGGEAFVLGLAKSEDSPPVVTFTSGPARELDSGHLLVETREQVGNDMTDEEPGPLPEGAQAIYRDLTGSIFVTRLTAIDVESAETMNSDWDAFRFATAGSERFVVFAEADPDVPAAAGADEAGAENRVAQALMVWDLEEDESRPIVECSGIPEYRLAGDEVLVHQPCDGDEQFLAVHGSTGEVREIDADEYGEAEAMPSPEPPALVDDLDIDQTNEGRPILYPPRDSDDSLQEGTAGMCGLGPYRHGEYLFTDVGVFRIPRDIELKAP